MIRIRDSDSVSQNLWFGFVIRIRHSEFLIRIRDSNLVTQNFWFGFVIRRIIANHESCDSRIIWFVDHWINLKKMMSSCPVYVNNFEKWFRAVLFFYKISKNMMPSSPFFFNLEKCCWAVLFFNNFEKMMPSCPVCFNNFEKMMLSCPVFFPRNFWGKKICRVSCFFNNFQCNPGPGEGPGLAPAGSGPTET